MTPPTMLEAALEYAARGWPIFPLRPKEKVPATSHGLKDATTDPERIREWWQREPDANIGYATGNGVAVIDIDELDNWIDLLEDVAAPVPDTTRVVTSRGWQLFFSTDTPIRNSAGKLKPGVDVRGDGGYVVLPPSVHPSGHVYRWDRNGSPAAMPAWLLDRLTARPATVRAPIVLSGEGSAYGRAALEDEVARVATAAEGTRNDTLNTAALKLGGLAAGGELDEHEVRGALLRAALTAGLSETEANATIKSGMTAGLGQPRTAPETRHLRSVTTTPTPAGVDDHRIGAPDDAPFRLTVRTAPEIDAEPDPPDSDRLLGPFVTRQERTILVGDTGHGKTSLALQMLRAILTGDTFLDHDGAGTGPVMIVDLEQGRRAIKRGLRDANLHERADVLHISVPDGLALDKDPAHTAELNRVIAEHRPAALLLDPYYKAHRADDPNQERPIIDLMRTLDALRVEHGFALLLPAHPRKEIAGKEGTRKLTLHDIAGSGAVTRGAEIVLGLERLAHGYARLRYLKDREGELPIGDTIALLFDKENGFRLDPREAESDEAIEARILATQNDWMTAPEWQKELGIRKAKAVAILGQLADSGRIAYMLGPPGRSKTARCYGTSPTCWEQSGTPGTQGEIPIESETGPGGPPPERGEHEREQSNDASHWSRDHSGAAPPHDPDLPL